MTQYVVYFFFKTTLDNIHVWVNEVYPEISYRVVEEISNCLIVTYIDGI